MFTLQSRKIKKKTANPTCEKLETDNTWYFLLDELLKHLTDYYKLLQINYLLTD